MNAATVRPRAAGKTISFEREEKYNHLLYKKSLQSVQN